MKSPCQKKCRINKGQCAYCYRTMHEIANWLKYTDEERDEIIKKCLERKDKWRTDNAL